LGGSESGDPAIVVVHGEPADQLDRVLVGADRRLRLGEGERQLGDRAALPADLDARTALLPVGVDDDLVDQAAQELLSVAVGGCRCGPHASEVGAERQQSLALLVTQSPRP
jgi:hypothetical protein